MGAPCISACSPWVESIDAGPCQAVDLDAGLIDESIAIATDVLYELSGRQFPGSCKETTRPVLCGCSWSGPCGCPSISEIELGGYPITRIEEVKIDGEVLAESEYRVDNFKTLVRLADANNLRQVWPTRQRMDLDTDQEDTFEVTYVYGQMPPPAGVTAAAALGCQLALSADPNAKGCTLPERVISITRQGISMAVGIDPFKFLDDGKTGVYVVDLFLKTYNRAGITRRATIASPDFDPAVRRADT